ELQRNVFTFFFGDNPTPSQPLDTACSYQEQSIPILMFLKLHSYLECIGSLIVLPSSFLFCLMCSPFIDP
ncbi:MAG: hypothetical protein ACJ71O_19400, partial [Nitrososphaeraceae archaeon]